MKSLIVGCGYLGRRVADRLLAAGEQVFATTRSAERASEWAALGLRPIVADVTRPENWGDWPTSERVLFAIGYDRSSGGTVEQVYVDGLRAVLTRLLRCAEGRSLSLIHASSTGVYGQTDGLWVDETSLTEPRSGSGRALLEAERVAAEFARREGWSVTSLRFAGLYGQDRLIRRSALERGEPIPGDPERWLNLIHIDDAVSAVLQAWRTSDAPGSARVLNIVDDQPIPRRMYYQTVCDLLGRPLPPFEPPRPAESDDARSRREEGNKRVSNRLAKEVLGFTPIYPSIATGVAASLAVERGTGD